MNEQNTPERSEQKPEGTGKQVSGGLREQIDEVSAEIDRVSAQAARRWKINALIFGLILAVIFSYLYFGIYRALDEMGLTTVEGAADMGVSNLSYYLPTWRDQIVTHMKDNADNYLNDYVAPRLQEQLEKLPDHRERLLSYLEDHSDEWLGRLDEELDKELGDLPSRRKQLVQYLNENAEDWVGQLDPTLEDAPQRLRQQRQKWAEQLKAQAPQFVENEVAPRLKEFQDSLPDRKKQIVQDLKDRAPATMDWVSEQVRNNGLPRARQQVQQGLSEQADIIMAEHQEDLDKAVREVLASHEDDIRRLREGDPRELQKMLEDAFEEKLGGRMDEIASVARDYLLSVRDYLRELAAGREKGTLTKQQKLSLRALQLSRTLIVRKLADYESGQGTQTTKESPSSTSE